MCCPILSVIVPVYNTEKYLRRCLDSISKQSFRDFEVLLIDDGSTDGSGTICDDYANKDDRFKVIHKTNEGVSSARNYGLKNAMAEWIFFLDADDWLSPGFFCDLQSDVNCYNVNANFFSGNQVVRTVRCVQKTTSIVKFKISCHALWCYFFKRSVIHDNNIIFNENITHGEDWLFLLEYLCYVESVHPLNTSFYNYLSFRPDSAMTQSVSLKNITMNYKTCFSIHELYIKYHSNIVYVELLKCLSYTINMSLKTTNKGNVFSFLYRNMSLIKFADVRGKYFFKNLNLLKIYFLYLFKLPLYAFIH